MTAVPWGSTEQVDAVIGLDQLVVEIMWPDGAWFCEGDSFVIAANITNIGEETIENVTATLTIDANASTTDPIKSVGDIEAGQWKVVTWVVKCERAGDSVITVTADGNDTDPAFATVAVFQFKCPHVVPWVEVTAPAQVYVGENYCVTAVYRHFYEETVENVTATIEIDGPASTTDSPTKAIGDIPAGETAEVTWNLTCEGQGGVNVIVTALGSNTNTAVDAAAIQQGVIMWDNLMVMPTWGYAPLEITASAEVSNSGNMATTTDAELYVDSVVVASQEVSLGAGAGRTVSFDYTLGVGTYNVTINGLEPVEVVVVLPGGNLLWEGANTVAYPGSSLDFPDVLTNIQPVAQIVWLRDPSTGGDWWFYDVQWDISVPPEFTGMETGKAYIVVVSEDCVWYVS